MAENDTTTGTTTVTSDTPYFDPAGTLTPDEYQKRFIDFYNMPTIEAEVIGDEDDDDDDDDQVVQPNVLAPVGNDDDRQTIFGQGTVLGEGKSFTFETLDYNKVINDYVDPSKAIKGGAKKEKSLGGFGKAIADMYKTPEGAIGSGVGFMMGLGPLGGPALSAMAEVNRKKQKQTADAISATGGTGGAMFKLNNQTVYRAPGSTQYGGTYSGTSSQLLGMEAITNGFLPGTFKDVLKKTGPGGMDTSNEYVKTGLAVAHADTDAMVVINANGNIVGLDGTMFSVSAGQATKARENHAKAMARAMGSNYTPTPAEALEIRQKGLAHMKATFNIGVLDRTSDLSEEESAARAKEYNRFTSDLMKQIIERQPGFGQRGKEGPSKQTEPATVLKGGVDDMNTNEAIYGDSQAGQGYDQSDAGFQDPEKPERSGPASDKAADDPGQRGDQGTGTGFGERFRALGGRVGLQEGGVAGAPAGFVERPPSQVSEAATVADDKPMSVPEGTFVINAAAVEFAGEEDIIEMLNVAYKKASKKGIKPPSRETLEVAVSRGEVIVPPFLAKIIGYDRLEKINNRGKKEVNQRIKENGQQPVGAAGGGFLTRKKLANGGEVDEYEDKIIADEVRRKMDVLMDEVTARNFENKDDPITVISEYFKSDSAQKEYADAMAERYDRAARTGNYFYNPKTKTLNVPKTPTLANLLVMAEEVAHMDAYEPGNPAARKNPYPAPEYSLVKDFNKLTGDLWGFRTPVMGEDFDPQETFDLEGRYLEEMRAKQIAFQTVFGGLARRQAEKTKAGRTLKYTRASYEQNFADYITAFASPVVKAAFFKKYPNLKSVYREVPVELNPSATR